MATHSHIIVTIVLILIANIYCNDEDPCGGAATDVSPCQQTEYEAYVQCIHSNKEIKRKKREADCPFASNATTVPEPHDDSKPAEPLLSTCKRIEFDCRSECAGNSSCEADCPVCPINADLVAAIPDSDNYRTIIFEGPDGQKETFQARIEAGRNVTTIIRLTNIINNTNTIHAPVNVSTTNLNNIQVHSNVTTDEDTNSTKPDFGLGTTADGSCCYVVRPKTCSASTAGMRCAHKRHKTCGELCRSRVMHAQSRQRCSQRSGKCTKKIVYVPEPSDTKNGTSSCVHSKKWPYVRCGAKKRSCNGCYDHYGSGFDQFYDDDDDDADRQDMLEKCHGCYDDGFDMGQMYRRGPVLRPSYYHEAPCYLKGTCVVVPMIMDCGYGCYGDQFVDPAWGNQLHDDDDGSYDDGDYLDDDSSKNNTNSSEWQVEVYKCKYISDDGDVEIKNCTETEFNENPYATSPSLDDEQSGDVAENDEDELFYADTRHRRHAIHRAPHVVPPAHHHSRNKVQVEKEVKGKVVEDEWDEEMDDEVEEEPEEHQFKRFVRQRKQHHKKMKKPAFVYDENDETDDYDDDASY